MRRTLLTILAHADDGSFGGGGTLAKHAINGARVVRACARRREVGEISDPALGTRETLGQVPEAERRAACATPSIL